MALMKLHSGYGQSQRALDELLNEAETAVHSENSPENATAVFTYFGVEVLFNAMSVKHNTKQHVIAALRCLTMPIVVPSPSPLSNEIAAKVAHDMNESEEERRNRLTAERAAVDAEMQALLDNYEQVLSRNDHNTPFMFADWVGKAMKPLCNPLMSYMVRQRFNYLMTSYQDFFRPLYVVDMSAVEAKEPHVQAGHYACRLVHDVVDAHSESRTPYGEHAFCHIVDALRNQQNAKQQLAA